MQQFPLTHLPSAFVPRASKPGSFRGETHRKGVPIVKVFTDALWTALPTIFEPKSAILHDFEYTTSKFFRRRNPRTSTEAPPVLGPRHQIPLVSLAFTLFLFYETTTVPSVLWELHGANWFQGEFMRVFCWYRFRVIITAV